MSDLKALLERAERAVSEVPLPPDGLEGLERRRDRKRRYQRIAAGVVGIAVFVAAVWIVTTAGSFDRTTTPADKPTVNSADTAKEVALGFLEAYAAFDAKKAITYVADDADLTGVLNTHQVSANTEGLSLKLSLLQAMGYEQTVTSCEAAAFGSDTSVICDYVFHALGSDQIGRGPFSGNYFVSTVRDGLIVRASWLDNLDKFDRQMWWPFAEWVSSTYPKDAAVMYLDGPRHVARFSLESIRLWQRHTREYVETRSAETGPAETGPTVVSDNVCPGGITAIPKDTGPWEKSDVVLDFSFGHTDMDVPRFGMTVHADGRVITRRVGMPDKPDGRFVQRLTPEGVELVTSEVLSTGLFEQDLHLGGARGLHYGAATVLDGDRLVRLSWGVVWGNACPEGAVAMMPSGEQASALKRLDSRLEDLAWLPESAWEDEVARSL
jgi:hypothetical protein